MGVDEAFMQLMGSPKEQGLSEAEAKILKELLNSERDPLFISELHPSQMVPFIVLKSFSEMYGLSEYKRFILVFLKSTVPLNRKRVHEVLRALRRESDDEKKSLWDKMRGK